jgi:arylsulfatase A-like enzyme
MPFTRKFIRDEGLNFEEGHADVPLCGPARVSLLTGMSITSHEVDVNATWSKFIASPLDLNSRTIATFLSAAGVACGHFGKYINGHAVESIDVPPGWKRWVEVMGDGKEDSRVNEDGEQYDLVEGVNASTYAAQKCAEFISDPENALTGWFAHYCPTSPHRPYTPSEHYAGMYDGQRRDVPSTNEANEGKPGWMKKLDPATGHQSEFEGKKEELRELDQEGIKHIYETLEATGQLENTVIIFTSDNGYHHAEHRLMRKDRPYWESAQVPFFIRGPGVPIGTTTDLVSHVDLFPTTLELMGVDVPSQADGRSLVPLLTPIPPDWRKRLLVTGSSTVGPNPGGANEPSGRWWLLREGVKAFILRESGFRELYWMLSDPYQMYNKAGTADQAMVDRMEEYVRAMKVSSGDARRALEVG